MRPRTAATDRLAEAVGKALASYGLVGRIRMFGGLCFTLRGNMCCGTLKDDLVVRVGPDRYEEALSRPYARPMDFTGRPIRGFVFVGPKGYASPAALRAWVRRGAEFAGTLPPKKGRA